MRETIQLTASDGHVLDAYVSGSEGTARAGLVVLQEIFGVTGHIRAVCDEFAGLGYNVIAPSLFDRVRKGVNLDYTDIPGGKALVEQTNVAETLLDIGAAVEQARAWGKVGVVGYCWGGTLAFLSASALPIDAAVAYYGGMIAKLVDRTPKVPVLYHFGGKDAFIPEADREVIRAALSPTDFYVYDEAAHGFNCNERADYHAASAALARERTAEFLQRHLG